jgi:hypothetical protein
VSDRFALWDFDGTLAWRPGMWSGCVTEVLDEIEVGHTVILVRETGGWTTRSPASVVDSAALLANICS